MRIYFKLIFYTIVATAFIGAKAGAYEDFFQAVELDMAGTVSTLPARGFDPNTVDERGQVGLYLALRDNSAKVAAVLLAAPGVKLDAANALGETPLMMAALRGNYDACVTLIGRDAKVRRNGWTPLHYAASGPAVKMVALILGQ